MWLGQRWHFIRNLCSNVWYSKGGERDHISNCEYSTFRKRSLLHALHYYCISKNFTQDDCWLHWIWHMQENSVVWELYLLKGVFLSLITARTVSEHIWAAPGEISETSKWLSRTFSSSQGPGSQCYLSCPMAGSGTITHTRKHVQTYII